jgi:tRNA (mo5U34)-methyltransferase
MASTAAARDLRREVDELAWYHTIELPGGVTTPGWFDLRPVARRLPFPPLDGLRCLDVGTFDGFWAFEMERRGAAEVIGLDILDEARWDWPVRTPPDAVEAIAARKQQGRGFVLARESLASGVERVDRSVYDLAPEVHGRFDFVYIGSLLLHLRDPVRALERVRSVTRGRLLSVDAVDVGLTLRSPRRPVAGLDGERRPYWWKPNLRAFAQLLRVAGLELEAGPRPFLVPPGAGYPRPPLTPGSLRDKWARELLLGSRLGDPHAYILARPLPD